VYCYALILFRVLGYVEMVKKIEDKKIDWKYNLSLGFLFREIVERQYIK